MTFRECVVCAAALAVLVQQSPGQAQATGSKELTITVGKSVLVDSARPIERVAVANGDLAEAVAVTPREVVVNGKAPGETSLIVWEQGGTRLFFDVTILASESRIDAVRREMSAEKGNENVTLNMVGDSIFLRGTVPDLNVASRAVSIASAIGKPVNLLRVPIPPTDAQILLKVKFADVDRSALQQLGLNLFSTNSKMAGASTTGQFSPPTPGGTTNSGLNPFNLTNALNLFLFRPDIDLGATIQLLQTNSLLEILAEPNVLAINGHNASFLAGGEFPYPTLQGGGAGLGAVTIQFREFGVRINFTPVITPRGTIQLTVTPEVSSLDYSNGLVFQGFTIPALSTRRVQTEVELAAGQSFAIGGLLDNNTTQTLSRIPGLGDIPLLGRLFRSRSVNKTSTELLVVVTPELVRPIPQGKPVPELKMPGAFLPPNTSDKAPQTPGVEVTGAAPPPSQATIPVEQLLQSLQPAQGGQPQPAIQFVPVPLMPVQTLPGAPVPAPVKPQPQQPTQQSPAPQPQQPQPDRQ
jgi:pilus assembly protein CpaC